jgi:hypothetical protein
MKKFRVALLGLIKGDIKIGVLDKKADCRHQ